MNQPIILWFVDSFDWKHRSKNLVYSKVMNNVHPEAIIHLYDIHPTTADALLIIFNSLKVQGYEFVTVTDFSN